MDLPSRKPMRLKDYDYSQSGAYFLTICTKDRAPVLSAVVGGGVLDAPRIQLKPYGQIVEKQIKEINATYSHLTIRHYVIMPNHVHLLVDVKENGSSGTTTPTNAATEGGTSRTPSPTNAAIPGLVSALKRFCNREWGENRWQRSYYDRVLRSWEEYLDCWEYMDGNPAKWMEDTLYTEDTTEDL